MWRLKYITKRLSFLFKFIYDKLSFRKHTITVGGATITLSTFTPYHNAIASYLAEGKYEPELLKKWVEEVKNHDLIFDVGGFNGVYGLLAAKINPKARVIIFEPDPVNLKHIYENIMQNSGYVAPGEYILPCEYTPLCEVIPAAASNSEGETNFISIGSTGSRIAPWGKDKIRTIKLSSYGAPTLMKLDVEGHENQVLEGADLSKLQTLFLEDNHKPNLPTFTETFRENQNVILKLSREGV